MSSRWPFSSGFASNSTQLKTIQLIGNHSVERQPLEYLLSAGRMKQGPTARMIVKILSPKSRPLQGIRPPGETARLHHCVQSRRLWSGLC
jgi:hypothetical protein